MWASSPIPAKRSARKFCSSAMLVGILWGLRAATKQGESPTPGSRGLGNLALSKRGWEA